LYSCLLSYVSIIRLFSVLAVCLFRFTAYRSLLSFPTRRSSDLDLVQQRLALLLVELPARPAQTRTGFTRAPSSRLSAGIPCVFRSEEHTSELQSRGHLVCRLLLEKKHIQTKTRLTCQAY